ncbi:MAG: PQQ-binding-like beta-propeller repeat protein [Candidatus Poribacteria bacterium]|nr:PQQ-binding-like beta-propeller repeat protein [Candidatus Poribacteria bacterium]
MPLSIENIDEQNIPINTTNYVLEIDIGGEPDRAYVDGAMEGFYQSWDADNAKLKIIAENITRLLSDAVWNVHLVKGSETLDSQIIYNVVPKTAIILDPGEQNIWKGELFDLFVGVENEPSAVRSDALLVGLLENTAEGGLDIKGKLPVDSILTESVFDANIYAETEGGSDKLAIPFTIKTHTGVYVFDEERGLRKIGPDAATLHWTYQAPEVVDDPSLLVPGTLRYPSMRVTPNGIILFSNINNHLLKVSPSGELLWTFSEASDGHYDRIDTLSGIFLYRSAQIYRINQKTGELIWQSESEFSELLFSDSSLYLFDESKDTLSKISAENEEVWTYQGPTGNYHTPRVGGDGIYLYRQGQTLDKISTETGQLIWSYNPSIRDITRLMTDETGAYLILRNVAPNQIRKINPADGTLEWTYTDDLIFNYELYPDGIFFIGARGLTKINKGDGTKAWHHALLGQYTNPIIQPNGIYRIGSNSNSLEKINRQDGSREWSVIRSVSGARLLKEDGAHLYIVAPAGQVTDIEKINVSDGSRVWRYDGTEYFTELAVPDFNLPD